MHGNMWIGCLYRYIRKSNEKIRNNTEWASESGKVGKKAKGRYFMVMLSAKESSRSFFITCGRRCPSIIIVSTGSGYM